MTNDEERSRIVRAQKLLEDFGRPEWRARATHELATLGIVAVRILATVFDGSARNRFGHPISNDGEVFRCALVSARLLGPIASPLREALAKAIAVDNVAIAAEAIRALAAMGIEETEVDVIAHALDRSPDVACEAVVALRNLGALDHPLVRAMLVDSPRARSAVERFGSMASSSG